MSNAYLAHHGVKGQKHGERRWQNPDGSLTPAGRIHYGVGAARKKVSDAAKSLKSQARSSAYIQKQRTEKFRKERAEAKAERVEARRQKKLKKLEAKKEARLKKAEVVQAILSAREAAKTLDDLKDALDETSLNRARKRVARLAEKRNREVERAMLKQEAKQLKQEAKDAKKNPKFLSRNEIRNMSDEEISARMDRLKRESDLAKAEVENRIPPTLRKFGDALVKAGTDAVSQVGRDALTQLGKNMFGLNGEGNTSTSKKYKDALAAIQAKDEYDDYLDARKRKAANRETDEQDEELRKAASRIQNLKTISDYERAEKNRAADEADEALKREAANARNRKAIEETKRYMEDSGNKKLSEEDRTKAQARRIAARKDREQRAEAYYRNGNGLSISEIAERMGLTESQVKDLLYQ